MLALAVLISLLERRLKQFGSCQVNRRLFKFPVELQSCCHFQMPFIHSADTSYLTFATITHYHFTSDTFTLLDYHAKQAPSGMLAWMAQSLAMQLSE